MYDGTGTNSGLPIRTSGLGHVPTKGQFVIPAAALTAMSGSTITGLKFYTTNDEPNYTPNCSFDVYMKEVGYTTMTALESKDNATTVYQGTLSIIRVGSVGELSITLNTSFQYMGGNLLIGMENTTTANNSTSHDFYGQEVTGAGRENYYSTFDSNYHDYPCDFIPKTTFTYTVGTYYAKPSGLTMPDITANSATISWPVPSVGATGYTYQYKKASDSSWSAETNVTTTSVTLSGLSANTAYNFRVKARYNGGDSDYTTLNFTTDCAAKSLPFSEGFESGTTCWTLSNCAAGTRVDNSIKHGGSYSFMFYQNSNPPQYLISPELICSSGVAVSFWYHNSTTGFPETFQVGYSTTTKSPSAFTWDEEITANNDQVWTRYRGEFPAGTKYVAVRYNSNYKVALYLDDFSVTPSMKPGNLSVNSITSNSATISWTAPSGDVTGYVYQYKKATDEAWSAEASTTATSVTLSGLIVNTDYNFRVKTKYNDNGECESPLATIDFRTPVPMPFMEGFEEGIDSWTLVDCHEYTKIGNKRHEGHYSFRFHESDPPQYLISPVLDGSMAMNVSFWYIPDETYYTETFHVGYSTTTKDPTAFTWGEEITASGDQWMMYDGVCPAGTKYIAIKYKYNTKTHYRLFVDDFYIEHSSHARPRSLCTSNMTINSATLSWTASASGVNSYIFQYKNASDDAWSAETSLTTTSVTINGLTDNTAYDFRVKAIYSDAESGWTAITFSTPRDAVLLPYAEGFESGLNGWTLVDCKTSAESSTGVIDVYHTGEKGFRFVKTTTPPQYLISPALEGNMAMKLSFWYKNSQQYYPETFQVGYSTTTKDIDAFTWGEEVMARNTQWTMYEENFPKGTYYIAIKCTSNNQNYLYFDDFSFEATSVYVESTIPAHTSAAINWTSESDIDSYQVKYRKSAKRSVVLSQDFENGAYAPWTTTGGTVEAGEGVGGGHAFRIYKQTNYLISPELSGIVDGAVWTFYAKMLGTGRLYKVGYSTTTNDTQAFTWSDVYNLGKDYSLYEYELPAGVKYVAIQSTSLNFLAGFYIDNIIIYNGVPAGAWQTVSTTEKSAVLTGLALNTDYDLKLIGLKSGVVDTETALTSFATLSSNVDAPLYLENTANNNAVIQAEHGMNGNVTLSGRTLYKDGYWNTLCLPFDVTIADSPLAGATAMVLDADNTSLDNEGELTLDFDESTTIPAGTPFIIKWDPGDNIVNPTFNSVTINGAAPGEVEFTGGSFVGQYSPFSIGDTSTGTYDGDLNEILYIGSNNKIGYSKNARTLRAFCAHFNMPVNNPAHANIRSITVNYNEEEETTGVTTVEFSDVTDEIWYTLDGRKLDGQPTTKGIYINNGRKVIIK